MTYASNSRVFMPVPMALVAIAEILDLDAPGSWIETLRGDGDPLTDDQGEPDDKGNQVRLDSGDGPGSRPRILYREARLHRVHGPAVRRQAAVDRAAHPRRRDPSGPLHGRRARGPHRLLPGHQLRDRRRQRELQGALGARRRALRPAEVPGVGVVCDLQGPRRQRLRARVEVGVRGWY